jgi:hypothetical protein
MDLDERASGADAELDDPFRSGGPDAPTVGSAGLLAERRAAMAIGTAVRTAVALDRGRWRRHDPAEAR